MLLSEQRCKCWLAIKKACLFKSTFRNAESKSRVSFSLSGIVIHWIGDHYLISNYQLIRWRPKYEIDNSLFFICKLVFAILSAGERKL